MPPKLCPPRLKKLIRRVNAGSTDEAHALRQILRAFHDRQQNKGSETFAVKSQSEITINLTNCKVSVRDELALALAEINSPSMVGRIRECAHPECSHLFWAGKAGKEACDRHAEQWRKRRQRRNEKKKRAEINLEREEAQLRKTINGLSRTAVAVIRVIMADRRRLFESIDGWALSYLRGSVIKVPTRYIVRQSLTKLVKDGYLTYRPDVNPEEDQYEPTEKLRTLWSTM
jgi:hypothetical protein